MKSRRIIGVLLIIFAVILMGIILWGMPGQNKKEKKSGENVKIEKVKKEKIHTNNEEKSEEEKTQQDEYPQEESELSDIKCEICDMRTEVKEQIKNYAAFENAIKNWMLMNGYTNEKIISRNDVTTQYDSGKKLYWMILEKRNKSFYVVEDMQSGTCKTIDKK